MKKWILGAILACLPYFVPGVIFGDISSSERAALVALYKDTKGDAWYDNSGWKTPPLAADGFAMPGTEEGWVGIYCTGNTTVTDINLTENNLAGSIPTEFGNLSNLQTL